MCRPWYLLPAVPSVTRPESGTAGFLFLALDHADVVGINVQAVLFLDVGHDIITVVPDTFRQCIPYRLRI